MIRDGRTLDHKTLEEIRRMAVERVREGEDPSVVIASYGFCRTTIYKWLKKARGRGRGVRALRSRKGTGRPPKLTVKQARQVFRWINGRDPRQHGFDFGLWTRHVVAELIADKFGIELSLASVGKLLASLGLTPQKPLMRAYERDPEAIEAWKRDTHNRTCGFPAYGSHLGCVTANACRMRSSACDTRSWLCVHCVLCWCACPLAPALRSTDSAAFA